MGLIQKGGLVDKVARKLYRSAVSQPEDPPYPALPSRFRVLDSLQQLLPDIYEQNILMHYPPFRRGDLPNDSALVLFCCLAASGFGPIVEFGTLRGRTTYNLALNSKDRVTTIDLGPSLGKNIDVGCNADGHPYPDYEPGEIFLRGPAEIRNKIDVVLGDSTKVDLNHLYGRVGMVIVDGGHSYEVCKSDSEKALKLIRPGGVILWDDYDPYWPGVQRALDELSATVALYRLPREGLVVHLAPPKSPAANTPPSTGSGSDQSEP